MPRFTGLVLSIVTVVLLNGCTLYSSIETPALPLSQSFSANQGLFATDGASEPQWWHRFDDPVLNDLVAQALIHNQDVHVALAQIERARAANALTRWAYLPSGNLDLRRERVNYGDLATPGQTRFDSYQSLLGVNWELDLFGRVRSGNRMAIAELEATHALADAVRLLIASEVTRTYFLARAAHDRHLIRAQALIDQHEVAELTRVLVEEQRLAADVLERALAELAHDEAELLLEEEILQQLQHHLAVLLGQQPGQWQLPGFSTEDSPLRLQAIAIGDVASLLQSRPDIRLAEHHLHASQAAVGVARASYFPALSLTGFFGFIAGNHGDLGSGGSQAWMTGPRLVWNVLDLGRTRLEAGIAHTNVTIAQEKYEATVLRAIEETENALLRYATAHSEIAYRVAQRRHARAAAAAALVRYEEGMANYLEPLVARRDALGAELAHVNSRAGHRIATVDVFRSLGMAPL